MVHLIGFAIVAILAVVVNGAFTPQVEQLKNDYFIKVANNNGHRLAGIQVLKPDKVKCDLVRRNIKKFGYCWEDENESKGINTTKERGWIREVLQQWEKCGGIKIVEEPKCRQGPDFVKIRVGNYHPVVYPLLGDPKSCRIDGFNMFLDFYTFGVNIEYFARTEKIRKATIQMYSLHEFGHFLGFDHEQNRLDRTECQHQIDAVEVGPDAYYANSPISAEYDIDSIMNYCRPNVFYKPWLSAIDKQAVRKAYGGGNAQECDAVTKPWVWTEADELDEGVVAVLKKERETGVVIDDNVVAPAVPAEPEGCFDRSKDCDQLRGSCKDEPMKYWCPKTCEYCQE